MNDLLIARLVEQARQRRDQAAAMAAQAEAALRSATQALELLQRYREDLRRKAVESGGRGTTIGRIEVQRRFDESLDVAIREQGARVGRLESDRMLHNEQVRQTQQRLAAFEKLRDRRLRLRIGREQRREQKVSDEAAARMYQHSTTEATR